MSVSRTRKAVASLAASVVMSGLLLLADPARAAADSLWDGVGPICAASGTAVATPDPRGCAPDDSLWD